MAVIATDRAPAVDVTELVETPAYVFDERVLERDASIAHERLDACGAHLLFAMKACANVRALEHLAGLTDGFHASSLFEARLAREVLGWKGLVHMTSPSIAEAEFGALCPLVDMLSFNSLTQWDRFRDRVSDGVQPGLRVNPDVSMIADERYDPCRRHSKLGAPISELREAMLAEPQRLEGLTGLLVHSHCESRDFRDLLTTVERLNHLLAPLLTQVEWLNLGGGYVFREGVDFGPLNEAVALLKRKYDLRVYMEPGLSIIGRAGTLVATVVDVFPSGGKTVAVLDASVNHMPEVFEFQYEPDVRGAVETGGHRYILAGATCLAGDLFGEYELDRPLAPGSRIVIENAGAYTTVKAHMFNGVNAPTVYWLRANGECAPTRRHSFEDFVSRCGGQ